jgi:hypothetical protein
MHDDTLIRTIILNTIAVLAALSLAACGKPSGPSAGAGGAPAKTAAGRYGISDAQQKKIAEIGKTIPGRQIVMEEPDRGVTYYVYVFEDGKCGATFTHRFFGKAYADLFDAEAGRASGYIVEKDKSLAYFILKNNNLYRYEGKTYDEVLADRKAFIKDASPDDRIVE